jgi:hypothetical protein
MDRVATHGATMIDKNTIRVETNTVLDFVGQVND